MTNLPAGSKPISSLATFAIDAPVFDPVAALSKFGTTEIRSSREALRIASRPLIESEPDLKGSECARIANNLRLVGMKLNPTMSGEQCSVWMKAIIAGLSDLPMHIAQRAASEAVHRSFRFFPEVDTFLRSRGDELHSAHLRAIARIDEMIATIRGATRPQQPMIEDKSEPLSNAEVRALQGTAHGKSLIRMGLAKGWIQPEQLTHEEDDSDR